MDTELVWIEHTSRSSIKTDTAACTAVLEEAFLLAKLSCMASNELLVLFFS